jgi:DNA polymerase IV
MEETRGARINQTRVREAIDTGASTLAAACPFCMTMFEDGINGVGAEDTFMTDIFDLDAARAELAPLAEKVWRHCETKQITGRTVTLKVKFADFQQITRSRTLPRPIAGQDEMLETARALLTDVFPVTKGIRLLGVTLSSLDDRDSVPTEGQLALF